MRTGIALLLVRATQRVVKKIYFELLLPILANLRNELHQCVISVYVVEQPLRKDLFELVVCLLI